MDEHHSFERARQVPDELLVMIFAHLPRGDCAYTARCSKRFYALLLPSIWRKVLARGSWGAVRRICMSIRGKRIAPLVQHFGLRIDPRAVDTRPDDVVVWPLFTSTVSKLVNLRVLVCNRWDLKPSMLAGSRFHHLRAVSFLCVDPDDDSAARQFFANHPNITALSLLDDFEEQPFNLPSFMAVGPGVPLTYLSVDFFVFLGILDHDANVAYRRLAPDCHVRLTNVEMVWSSPIAMLCIALEKSQSRIGTLELQKITDLNIIPGVTTDRIDGLRIPLHSQDMGSRFLRELLGMCRGSQTLEFKELRRSGGRYGVQDLSERQARDALDSLYTAFPTLRVVITWWNTRWERKEGSWIETDRNVSRVISPFDMQ